MPLVENLLNWRPIREALEKRDSEKASAQSIPYPYGGIADHNETSVDPNYYYRKLAWIQIAVNTVAEAAAAQSLHVKRKVGEALEDVGNHAFEELMQSPNEIQTGFEFLVHGFSQYKLSGNAFFWVNRPLPSAPPVELIPLDPQNIAPVPDKSLGVLKGYLYTNGSVRIAFPKEEIVHVKRFNPYSIYSGLSPLDAYLLDARADIGMQKVQARHYGEHGGHLPGILAFDHAIADGDWEKIQAEFKENSFKRQYLLLRAVGNGLHLIQNSVSQADMKVIESREITKEVIYNLFAPGLISILSENATEANAVTGENTMASKSIYPLLRAFGEQLTRSIMPMYGPDLVAVFDDPRVVDTELELVQQKLYMQSHTLDEIRAKYYGDDALPEIGNKLPIQLSSSNRQLSSGTSTLEISAGDDIGKARMVDNLSGISEDLQKWERKASKRVNSGRGAACSFQSDYIPEELNDLIYEGLEKADCADCVAGLFEDVQALVKAGNVRTRSTKFTPRGANVKYGEPEKIIITKADIEEAAVFWDQQMTDYKGLLNAEVSPDA